MYKNNVANLMGQVCINASVIEAVKASAFRKNKAYLTLVCQVPSLKVENFSGFFFATVLHTIERGQIVPAWNKSGCAPELRRSELVPGITENTPRHLPLAFGLRNRRVIVERYPHGRSGLTVAQRLTPNP